MRITVLNQIISQYLKSHKRLILPGLGAFIVKDPGREVVFTEMLRRDDGVLAALLVSHGTPELEAAGEIDRLVFEIRHAVQNGSSYLIEGLGVLRQGDNSTIAFSYEPETVAVVRPEPRGEQPAAAAPASEQPLPASEPAAEAAPAAVEPAPAEETPAGETPAAPAPAWSATDLSDHDNRGNCYQKHLDTGRMVNTVETAFADEKRMHEDDEEEPSLDDLQYRRPYKNTDAYTYVHHSPRKKGSDRFIWIAIIAALVALGAIAFGYWREMNDLHLVEEDYMEEMSQVQE